MVTLAGAPENTEPGRDMVRRVGRVRSVVAVLDGLGHPVKDVRWTARGK